MERDCSPSDPVYRTWKLLFLQKICKANTVTCTAFTFYGISMYNTDFVWSELLQRNDHILISFIYFNVKWQYCMLSESKKSQRERKLLRTNNVGILLHVKANLDKNWNRHDPWVIHYKLKKQKQKIHLRSLFLLLFRVTSSGNYINDCLHKTCLSNSNNSSSTTAAMGKYDIKGRILWRYIAIACRNVERLGSDWRLAEGPCNVAFILP